MYPTGLIMDALRDNNGGQERTFSAATWMDDKLKTQQKDSTYEMKVLLYKNKDLINKLENMVTKTAGEEAFEAKARKEAAEATRKLFHNQVQRKKGVAEDIDAPDDASEKSHESCDDEDIWEEFNDLDEDLHRMHLGDEDLPDGEQDGDESDGDESDVSLD